MSLIQITNLYRTYNATTIPVQALNGISLTVEAGEFTAIVGPSGSGKTTLLNMIGGLDSATGGSIRIGGMDITNFTGSELINFRLKYIGFVFQAYNLIPVLTAKENVEFIMLLQNHDKEEREKRAMELLEEVGLADRADNKPSEMSGGQQQRVAVARALASKPQYVLADEPTANLDGASTRKLLDTMAMLNRIENTTFIFSTHDQRVIERARRVITLEDGLVTEDFRR
ncbi:MAG: ABC transporter ATP-binding protein [Chlorobi bacterium]|nr:MAG: ABC transporter ATP-binding protein [Bacteroidota bacterium]MBL1161026.1 ABC transporter ATP-binding protein [Chlorobiota bacterium]MBZ0194870.1 ABC transporter ATP-binding protein [Candidatus Kapabacteria bacterium]MCC6331854.1 ABC transporter ATP-binding protein [Ignavibacteria bacterium]MBV6463683.1 putative ABC transporter ATP-binding protein YknY [Chlorobiota bacterium]